MSRNCNNQQHDPVGTHTFNYVAVIYRIAITLHFPVWWYFPLRSVPHAFIRLEPSQKAWKHPGVYKISVIQRHVTPTDVDLKTKAVKSGHQKVVISSHYDILTCFTLAYWLSCVLWALLIRIYVSFLSPHCQKLKASQSAFSWVWVFDVMLPFPWAWQFYGCYLCCQRVVALRILTGLCIERINRVIWPLREISYPSCGPAPACPSSADPLSCRSIMLSGYLDNALRK